MICKQKNKQARNSAKVVVGCMILILLGACGEAKPKWPPPLYERSVSTITTLEQMWSQSNVFIKYDVRGQMMSAAGGELFFIGSLDLYERDRIIALNIHTGELLWTIKGPDTTSFDNLYANQQALYVGAISGFAEVARFDPTTGDQVWSKTIWGPNTVLHFWQDQPGELSVYLNPNFFYVLAEATGKTIKHYRSDYTWVEAKRDGGKALQKAQVGGDWQLPLFTEKIIYVRTETILGRVYAVDKETGEVLWRSERQV